MLSGSAIVRVSVLLVAAGLLAALTQFLWPRGTDESTAEVPTVAAPPPERSAGPERPTPAPAPPPDLQARPASPPVQEAPVVREPAPARVPAPGTAQIPPQLPSQAPVPLPEQDPTAPAQERADPRAVTLVDLNTATVAQLNGLKGGGNIGRAIVQKRPYASVDQLLAKRVLSRATYERIKDQVTVQ